MGAVGYQLATSKFQYSLYSSSLIRLYNIYRSEKSTELGLKTTPSTQQHKNITKVRIKKVLCPF